MSLPLVLDPACGPRMMWFDKNDPRAVFGDIRNEENTLCDGRRRDTKPDVELDFRDLPYPDDSFRLVVFDPPHLNRLGPRSYMRATYGQLLSTWREDLSQGFAECFRVLKPEGILIFKWNETQIPVTEILALTPEQPLFGHKSGKNSKTHWIAFMKGPADE